MGLGSLVEKIDVKVVIDYDEIFNFKILMVISYKGCFVCGELNGFFVFVMEGWFYMYEGYLLKQIMFFVWVMKELGVDFLVVFNVCGGMNFYYQCGDIMVIDDYINLMGDNLLIGINDDCFGLCFFDMCELYMCVLVE